LGNSAHADAVVIGSGPNGLAAAITLARAGRCVLVHEAASGIGGGARTGPLTLPGFLHDLGSAVHPMAVSSPCFEEWPLAAHGLQWIHPTAPLAHPFDDGTAALLERSIDATARTLGPDGEAWRRIFEPLAAAWPQLRHDVLRAPLAIPRHPAMMARFGLQALRPARSFAEAHFRGSRARALFAGLAGHSVVALEDPASAGIGLVIAMAAHSVGWPVVRGGSGGLSEALGSYLRSLGGEIRTGSRVETLPDAGIVMCDLTPRQFLALAGGRLAGSYRSALKRFRYGPGVFKMDWALDRPIPWRAQECLRAATVHVGGTIEEIARWESSFQGAPFLILTQPSLFDSSRAPAGKHTAWAYCHVPNGSAADMTDAIENQVERFAPGFRASILARHAMDPAALERWNPNLVGGDIGGGAMSLRQILFRPTWRQYRTPLAGVYLCSSSTPPGGGVHGMCGYWAAQLAVR
jgi:phytoene dehydrogenase-like protein